MNSDTGQVVSSAELNKRLDQMSPEARREEARKWVRFHIGEEIELRGIIFKVHDVGEQRLVLKFVKSGR